MKLFPRYYFMGLCLIIIILLYYIVNELQSIAFYLEFLAAAAAASSDKTALADVTASKIRKSMHLRPEGKRIFIHALMHLFYNSKGCDQDVSVSFPEYKRNAMQLQNTRV